MDRLQGAPRKEQSERFCGIAILVPYWVPSQAAIPH